MSFSVTELLREIPLHFKMQLHRQAMYRFDACRKILKTSLIGGFAASGQI